MTEQSGRMTGESFIFVIILSEYVLFNVSCVLRKVLFEVESSAIERFVQVCFRANDSFR